MICPNKNHPDWKALSARVGETRAMLMFIQNDYQIPTSSSKNRGSSFDSIKGTFIRSASTLDLLSNNPKLASEIIDSLKVLYPEVKIGKDGIVDSNGQYVEIQPGEKGMHYRHAFESMVAWANDAYLETPPHEYAHHYIDMFRNHPLVAEAIEKYSEEGLVEKIGRYYAGQYTNSAFENFLQRFWNMARSLFGHPNIAYKISKKFAKGENIDSEVSRGTAIVRYQKANKPYTRTEGLVIGSDEKTESHKKQTTSHLKDFVSEFREELNVAQIKYQNDTQKLKEWVREELVNTFAELEDIDLATDRTYRNIIDKRFLDEANADLNSADFGLDLAEYMGRKMSGQEIESGVFSEDIVTHGDEYIQLYLDSKKRIDYVYQTRNELLIDSETTIDGDKVVSTINAEIEVTSIKRTELFNKIKNKNIREFFKMIGRLLNKYQINARLQSKFLSGDEDSVLTKTMYHEFNEANHQKSKLLQKIQKFYANQMISDELKNSSSFYNKKATISELGSTFSIESDGKMVQLTKPELMSVYLMLRQEDARKALMKHGFVLNDIIEGRINPDKEIKIDDSQAELIENTVKNNPEMVKTIEQYDKVYKTLYPAVNKAYKTYSGFELPQFDNYFPVAQGRTNNDQRRSMKNVDYLQSSKTRLGLSKPVRISDPFMIVNNSIANSSHYASYAVPLRNARLVLSKVEGAWKENKSNPDYKFIMEHIDSLKGNLNRIEDSSQLFSSQGEEGFAKKFDQIMNNFTVSILALNIPVMFKQPVSYLTAKEEIDSKYLAQAGWGVGGIVGIKPKEVFKSLRYTGVRGGVTSIPIEWKADIKNETYNDILDWSPILAERFGGQIDRELGETMMDATVHSDIIEVPMSSKLNKFLTGKEGNVQMSKNRMMEGIKIFDTATIMAIWRAVELETQQEKGLTKADGKRYYEHVAMRTEEIVNKTQPTFDMNNRSSLSGYRNPMARFFTMFSSARSKVAMLIIEGAVDLMNNPSKANYSKFAKRMVNLTVLSSATLVAIDLLKQLTLGSGFDDDEEVWATAGMKMISNNTGLFFGVGTMTDFVLSKLDDKPWHKSIQHPVNTLAEDFGSAIASTFKGDFDKALLKSIEGTAKLKGAPLYPYIVAKNVGKRLSE